MIEVARMTLVTWIEAATGEYPAPFQPTIPYVKPAAKKKGKPKRKFNGKGK